MMIRTTLLSLILFCISIHTFSQKKSNAGTTDVTKITIINPGISYEKSISKSATIYFQGFMNLSATYQYSSYYGNDSKFYFDPAVMIQPRFYYNLAKRDLMEKRVDMNSGNYLAPILQIVFSKRRIKNSAYDEKVRRPQYTVGLTWGLQRNYKKRFSFDFNIGVGYLTTKSYRGYGYTGPRTIGQLIIPGQLNIGFWLNKRK